MSFFVDDQKCLNKQHSLDEIFQSRQQAFKYSKIQSDKVVMQAFMVYMMIKFRQDLRNYFVAVI